MQILTSRFGKISFSSKEVYNFSKGIYGFPQEKKFIFLKLKEDEPFLWLQSIQRPDLAFLLVDPFIFFRGYKPEIAQKELQEIKAANLKSVEIYVIVTLPADIKQAQLNLLAPLLINPGKKLGRQVVLKSSDYKTQHSIFSQLKKRTQKNSRKR